MQGSHHDRAVGGPGAAEQWEGGCASRHQNPLVRMACQMPLHRSPEMIPLHRPAPELPTSRPLPLALDAPTDIVTATLPPRPMPPLTLPPPAEETRWPDTVRGTRLVELQLPAVGVKAAFQTPS